MKHSLKVNPQFFESLAIGAKNFEVRRNDRNFSVMDLLLLHEYDPKFGYTTRQRMRVITYILATEDLPIALKPGYVVLGLCDPSTWDDHK